MCDPMVIKVCVIVDKTENLYSINKNDSLEKVITDICKEFNKKNPKAFGLQICVDEANKRYVYLSEENSSKIIHGTVLKLLPSIDFMISSIFGSYEYDWKQQSEWLKPFSDDTTFVARLKEEHLLTLLQNIESSKPDDLYDSMYALSNILDHINFKFLTSDFISYVLGFLISTDNIDLQTTTLVLKLLGQIISDYHHFRPIIYENLKISELIPYLLRDDYSDLQLYTLIIINNFVKFSGDNKPGLIDEINTTPNKKIIMKYVIKNANENKMLAHQLYVYQTYILSNYNQYTKEYIYLGLNHVPHAAPKLFTYGNRDSLIDFEEVNKRKSNNSMLHDSVTDGPLSPDIKYRSNLKLNRSYRVISTSSDSQESQSVEGNIQVKQKNVAELQPANVLELTSICLEYYKTHYKKNYSLSVQESNHEPGFYTVTDDVCQILCKLLDIGDEPDSTSTFFHPLVFAGDNKKFVEELFCRALWLLARTRREMKARTLEDHEKVLPVLERQIRMTLETKPMKYKQLTDNLRRYTHEKVYNEWEKEREQSWQRIISKHPDVTELRKKFEEANTLLIKEQRLNILRKGAMFPKITEKKGRFQNWQISLEKNKLVYGDCYDDGLEKNEKRDVNVSDIMHVVSGVVCPHVKDHRIKKCELIHRCFSILFENEGSLDFLASSEDLANKWVDGLHFLIGKPMTSTTFVKELEEMTTMDLNLHLLELQGLVIPLEPPEVPPLPAEYRSKPPKPPKPHLPESLCRKTIIIK